MGVWYLLVVAIVPMATGEVTVVEFKFDKVEECEEGREEMMKISPPIGLYSAVGPCYEIGRRPMEGREGKVRL